MTAHTCRVFNPYCYRCDLNLDELEPPLNSDCPTCGGEGEVTGRGMHDELCPTCGGLGRVHQATMEETP